MHIARNDISLGIPPLSRPVLLCLISLPLFFRGSSLSAKHSKTTKHLKPFRFHGSKDCNWRLNCLHARLYARSSSTLQFNFTNKETPFSLLLFSFFFFFLCRKSRSMILMEKLRSLSWNLIEHIRKLIYLSMFSFFKNCSAIPPSDNIVNINIQL